jgi:hypothetical protein
MSIPKALGSCCAQASSASWTLQFAPVHEGRSNCTVLQELSGECSIQATIRAASPGLLQSHTGSGDSGPVVDCGAMHIITLCTVRTQHSGP